MPLPDLSNMNWRAYASFAAIVGGTSLACLGGGVAVLGAGLVSLFINVAAADAAMKWAEERRKPKYEHANHDLTRLVAAAVSRVLHDSDAGGDSKQWFAKMADVAESNYLDICRCVSLAELFTENLPELFEAAANEEGRQGLQLLTSQVPINGQSRTVAYGLVLHLRDAASLGSSNKDTYEVFAEKRLINGLFAAVRELFKRAYEGNDRAFGALCLDIDGEILARLSMILNLQKEMNQRLIELSEAHLDSIDSSQVIGESLSKISVALTDVSGTLGAYFAPSAWPEFVRRQTTGRLILEIIDASAARGFFERQRPDDVVLTKDQEIRLQFDVKGTPFAVLFAVHQGVWICLDIADSNKHIFRCEAGRNVLPSGNFGFPITVLGRLVFSVLLLRDSPSKEIEYLLEQYDSRFDNHKQNQMQSLLNLLPSDAFSFLRLECFVKPPRQEL